MQWICVVRSQFLPFEMVKIGRSGPAPAVGHQMSWPSITRVRWRLPRIWSSIDTITNILGLLAVTSARKHRVYRIGCVQESVWTKGRVRVKEFRPLAPPESNANLARIMMDSSALTAIKHYLHSQPLMHYIILSGHALQN